MTTEALLYYFPEGRNIDIQNVIWSDKLLIMPQSFHAESKTSPQHKKLKVIPEHMRSTFLQSRTLTLKLSLTVKDIAMKHVVFTKCWQSTSTTTQSAWGLKRRGRHKKCEFCVWPLLRNAVVGEPGEVRSLMAAVCQLPKQEQESSHTDYETTQQKEQKFQPCNCTAACRQKALANSTTGNRPTRSEWNTWKKAVKKEERDHLITYRNMVVKWNPRSPNCIKHRCGSSV